MNTQIPTLMPGAKPFLFAGNEIGCLCLHGLTASPAEVRWLGEHLSDLGFTTYGPRLAGHGADYRHLAYLSWQDWYLSALDGYHLLRERCKQVYVLGLSMGGLLALLLAAQEPVEGIVVMGTPVESTTSDRLWMAKWMKHIRTHIHLPDESDFPQRLKAEQQRRGEPPLGRVRYDTWSFRAIEALNDLMQTVDANLTNVTAPALLIYSKADQTVPISNQPYIHRRLCSTVIRSITLEKSGHILTQDMEYLDVLRHAGEFIQQAADNALT